MYPVGLFHCSGGRPSSITVRQGALQSVGALGCDDHCGGALPYFLYLIFSSGVKLWVVPGDTIQYGSLKQSLVSRIET